MWRIQLLSARGRARWPAQRRALDQRYRDAPAAELVVPTLLAFAASKKATWADRRAPRDLWDLWALSRISWPATTFSTLRRPMPSGGRNSPAKHGSLSTRFRFGVAGQAFTSSTLRHRQTVVAPPLLDVLVIDHPGSPGSATRRAGSSAEDTVRGMMGGG
jgi:hypothetical protein